MSGSAPAFDRRAVRDLVLRLGDTVAAADVVHVPRVLYHRRVTHAALPADDVEIVRHALARRRVEADVLPGETGLRIRYRTSSPPSVTVVIATRDHLDSLRTALESVLEKTEYEPFDLLIVDNDSAEPQALGYLDEAGRRPRVRVLRSPGPFNYSAIHNDAVKTIASEIIVLLNNDTEVLTTDWLTELVSHAARPDVGAAGAKLLFPDGTLQHAGVVLGATGIANDAFMGECEGAPAMRGRADAVQEYSAVTAACLAMRRALFLEMGGFDASRFAVRFNDVDLCLRLREAGYRIVWTPHAVLRHRQAASIGAHDETPGTWARFAAEVAHMSERWGDALWRDPFYSPNLDLNAADFSLAFPPRLPRYELP